MIRHNQRGSSKRVRFPQKAIQAALLITGICGFNIALQAQSLEQRLSILEQEIESLKLVRATKKYESIAGLGPAASGVYHSNSGLSIGGYGEAKYANYESAYRSDTFDLHRFILYTGYKFNDWILLNTEIEIEHVNEVFVEFAYLDFLFDPSLSLGLGLQLIPSGITNYQHEPTTFYSVNRPQTERHIIPSSWREHGAMLHGELDEGFFSYRLGIFSGGRARNFNEASWIRGGRQNGAQARGNDLAGAASLEMQPLPSLRLGFSYYMGDNGQGEILAYDANESSQTLTEALDEELAESEKNRLLGAKVRTHLGSAHFLYEWGPLSLRGLWARGWMSDDDTRAVNRNTGKNIGKVAEGSYLEAAFNVSKWIFTERKLYFFVRREYLNTQKETVTCQVGLNCVSPDYQIRNPHEPKTPFTGNRAIGIIENDKYDTANVKGLPNPANDRRIWVYGLAYFPHPNVVLKADFENWDSRSSEEEKLNPENNKIDRFNLSVGWIF